MRMIDADKLHYNRIRIAHRDGTVGGYNAVVMSAEIKDAPAVDAVPVVRCKDCIHYEMGVCLKIYDDGTLNKDAWQKRNPNDFCSYGECKPTHCKDCKWWDSNSWACTHPVHGSPLSTPDFFCTDGERKGGDE